MTNASATASQKQIYNKSYYVRKVVMDSLEERLWERLRHEPDGRSKFYVWRDDDDYSRFHVIVNSGNVRSPKHSWVVDLWFPTITGDDGMPRIGNPVLTLWGAGRENPLARYTGDTNRKLAGYVCDAILSDLIGHASFK